jgi:hypothetical protein
VSFSHKKPTIEIVSSDFMTPDLYFNSEIPFPYDRANAEQTVWHEKSYKSILRASTLWEVLDTANAPSSIDFLSLDVKGFELEVLRDVDRDNTGFAIFVLSLEILNQLVPA